MPRFTQAATAIPEDKDFYALSGRDVITKNVEMNYAARDQAKLTMRLYRDLLASDGSGTADAKYKDLDDLLGSTFQSMILVNKAGDPSKANSGSSAKVVVNNCFAHILNPNNAADRPIHCAFLPPDALLKHIPTSRRNQLAVFVSAAIDDIYHMALDLALKSSSDTAADLIGKLKDNKGEGNSFEDQMEAGEKSEKRRK